MKKLFEILSPDFFKPLTSKYKTVYADCILLVYNNLKPEISYGVNRELVVKVLSDYFELDEDEMTFDDVSYIKDAREKANGVIGMLRNCGWLSYEEETNHQINIVLNEYAIPVIESMNKIIHEEEAEYQGIISQIHASLQNQELYQKPYELVIKGVKENTDRLISELKKLNASIKRHMDKQTNEMEASQILEHFFEYHQNIGSKAYLRMKTSENISYFRSSIIEKIDDILMSQAIIDRAVAGYQEVEQCDDKEEAYDNIVSILQDVKSAFYRLDEIIEEIDRKHTKYMRNAVMRARFKLATGNNLEGKLSRILEGITRELDQDGEDNKNELSMNLERLFSLFPQNSVSPESLKTIPVTKKNSIVNKISEHSYMTEEQRKLHKEALRQKNRNRFSRKNINDYVVQLLGDRKKMSVEEIQVSSRRDLIRIIYISIYAGNRANNYYIERSDKRVKIENFEFPYFDIVKKD